MISTTAPVFVDTNVLVYSWDSREAEKMAMAEQWLRRIWRLRAGRLGFQVLSEFYVTVTRKWRPGVEVEVARREVRRFMAWNPVPLDANIFESAWKVQDRFGLSWWDAAIVAAALAAGCRYLLTEDLGDGQDFDGVIVVNPFRTGPDSILPGSKPGD